jgi:hypothetical protein
MPNDEDCMPTVRFLGKVLPEIAQVSVGHNPVIKWESPDLGLIMEFTNTIEKSRIDVECKLNRYAPSDFITIYMRALDLSRASVDVVAFAMGWGLTVVLETFVDPNGQTSTIAPIDNSLPLLCTAFNLANGFDEVYSLVLTDPSLFMALNDLILAITLPHVSTVNCARAIEGLRHLIALPGTSDKQAWAQMREALRLDIAYLKLITDNSAASRHGSRDHVPGNVTTEITRRSWIIMNRYFEYRKRGSQPLLEVDFPLLVG